MPIEYVPAANRYRDTQSKKFVSRSRVLRDIDVDVAKLKNKARILGRQLERGSITIAEFQEQIAKTLKDGHLRMAMVGAGGRKRMTPRRLGYVGGILNAEYKKLNSMAQAIADGEVSLKQLLARLNNYGETVRATFHWNEKESNKESGKNAGERWLTPGFTHCAQCIAYATGGLVPIDDVIPVATQCDCGGNCKCVARYVRLPLSSSVFR